MRAGPHEFFSRTFEISSVDRILFPEDGITKGALIEYYARAAELMLPHLKGRPVALKRYPSGLAGAGFFQKNASPHYPDWIHRQQIPKREGGSLDHVIVDEPATIVYLANQGTIELHPWLSEAADLEHPVELIFDLDPPEGADVAVVRAAARHLRVLLGELEVPSRLKTSGSAGFHIHVPLDGSAAWEVAGGLAQRIAATLAARYPDDLTTRRRRKDRGDRVLLDWFRAGYGQTSVAAYSVRARPGAPVATPIEWDELGKVAPRTYGVRNLFRRLGQRDDPWQVTLPPVAAGAFGPALDELAARR
jgi:bifunctional non-homologous end joining protein LigD